jgi:hypothetical protein
VFDADQIEAYIDLKMEENMRYEMTPHPVEFDMYYSRDRLSEEVCQGHHRGGGQAPPALLRHQTRPRHSLCGWRGP